GTPVTGDVSAGDMEAEQENDEQEEGEESKLLKALSNPLFGENAIGRMFRNMFGQSSSPSEDSDSDGSGPSAMRTAATMRPGRRKGGQVAGGVLTKVLTPGG